VFEINKNSKKIAVMKLAKIYFIQNINQKLPNHKWNQQMIIFEKFNVITIVIN